MNFQLQKLVTILGVVKEAYCTILGAGKEAYCIKTGAEKEAYCSKRGVGKRYLWLLVKSKQKGKLASKASQSRVGGDRARTL